MATKKSDTVEVVVRLPRAVADALKRAAGDRTKGAYVAELVSEHLENLQPTPPTARSSG